MKKDKFGYWVKFLRNDKGYTQKHCALHCEVSVVTWQNWESGVTTPNSENMAKIKKMFDRED
jgi:transcriptional regulator with XRE-family HTH domain